MKPRPRTPALWILGHRRRPSATMDTVEAERRATYASMDPGERLARALPLPSPPPPSPPPGACPFAALDPGESESAVRGHDGPNNRHLRAAKHPLRPDGRP